MTYIFNVVVLNVEWEKDGLHFIIDSILEQFKDNINYNLMSFKVDKMTNKLNVKVSLKDATEKDKKIVRYHLLNLFEDWTYWLTQKVQQFNIRIKKVNEYVSLRD